MFLLTSGIQLVLLTAIGFRVFMLDNKFILANKYELIKASNTQANVYTTFALHRSSMCKDIPALVMLNQEMVLLTTVFVMDKLILFTLPYI